MTLSILSPDEELFNGEVNYVQFPGKDGSFGVLKDHAPIVSSLTKGTLLIKDTNNQEQTFEISGGVVEVMQNKIIVLAD
ncbi:MAG: ATP synthase F1 subunit epsilon [Flavobacteriales bacterium]|nr:ATP synthase F1 subunit epsilon [Flavobacteriales bacterium]